MMLAMGITLVILFAGSSYLMVDFGNRLRKLTGKKRYTWIPMGWMAISTIAMALWQPIYEVVRNGHLHP